MVRLSYLLLIAFRFSFLIIFTVSTKNIFAHESTVVFFGKLWVACREALMSQLVIATSGCSKMTLSVLQ